MKEEEIRPQEIFDEFLRLAEQDSLTYFQGTDRRDIPCPACGAKGIGGFEKSGFSYQECPECLTLYVSPRPEADAFEQYYLQAASVRYWATTFYKLTEENRREKLWRPKAAQLARFLAEQGGGYDAIVDIGGGFGTFVEELVLILPKTIEVVVVEPNALLAAECRNKGFRVVEHFLEDVRPGDLPSGRTVFTSFELFEHLHHPRQFLLALDRVMATGDIFYFSTLSSLGIDVRVLWENSKAISPPHHLNFLNPGSLRRLVESIGWKVLSLTTPGKLDIDIMLNSASSVKDRFWSAFLRVSTVEQRERMQKCVSELGYSSHMLAACEK